MIVTPRPTRVAQDWDVSTSSRASVRDRTAQDDRVVPGTGDVDTVPSSTDDDDDIAELCMLTGNTFFSPPSHCQAWSDGFGDAEDLALSMKMRRNYRGREHPCHTASTANGKFPLRVLSHAPSMFRCVCQVRGTMARGGVLTSPLKSLCTGPEVVTRTECTSGECRAS